LLELQDADNTLFRNVGNYFESTPCNVLDDWCLYQGRWVSLLMAPLAVLKIVCTAVRSCWSNEVTLFPHLIRQIPNCIVCSMKCGCWQHCGRKRSVVFPSPTAGTLYRTFDSAGSKTRFNSETERCRSRG
jgi:hypothetical protein